MLNVTYLYLQQIVFCLVIRIPKQPTIDPKLQSLREQGTLNPHPQAVTDDLFAESEFFDPRDLMQVKYEMLRRVEKDRQSVTEAATKFGFSRPSFYQAQTAVARGGLAGLIPLKRGPKQARKLTAEIMEFLQQARQEDPTSRAASLASLIKERFDVAVHPRTVERALVRDQEKRQRPG